MGVVTAAAIVGIAGTVAGTALSFSQAAQAKKEMKRAQRAAARDMAAAEKMLDINYLKGLSIQKEPYELEREALLSAGAQAIEAGRESERGAAATAGRVMMAQQEAQADVRTAMGKELTDIEKQILGEESRLRDIGVDIKLASVEGAQQAAADAWRARQMAISQGVQGLTNMGTQLIASAPLYGGKTTPTGSTGAKVKASGPAADSMFTPQQNMNAWSLPSVGGIPT